MTPYLDERCREPHAFRVLYRDASPPAFDLAAPVVRRLEVRWVDLALRRSGWRTYRIENGAKIFETQATDPEPYVLSEGEAAAFSAVIGLGASEESLVLAYENWEHAYDI